VRGGLETAGPCPPRRLHNPRYVIYAFVPPAADPSARTRVTPLTCARKSPSSSRYRSGSSRCAVCELSSNRIQRDLQCLGTRSVRSPASPRRTVPSRPSSRRPRRRGRTVRTYGSGSYWPGASASPTTQYQACRSSATWRVVPTGVAAGAARGQLLRAYVGSPGAPLVRATSSLSSRVAARGQRSPTPRRRTCAPRADPRPGRGRTQAGAGQTPCAGRTRRPRAGRDDGRRPS